MFEYMTAQQAAEKWNVSLRWVQRLYKEKHIAGVMNINRIWLIPDLRFCLYSLFRFQFFHFINRKSRILCNLFKRQYSV